MLLSLTSSSTRHKRLFAFKCSRSKRIIHPRDRSSCRINVYQFQVSNTSLRRLCRPRDIIDRRGRSDNVSMSLLSHACPGYVNTLASSIPTNLSPDRSIESHVAQMVVALKKKKLTSSSGIRRREVT